MCSEKLFLSFFQEEGEEMKRHFFVVLVGLFLLMLVGCKASHPSKIVVDPSFNPNEIVDILVVPFISSIGEGEDPKRFSETIMNKVLWERLSERDDYKFLSPQQFSYAMNRAGLSGRFGEFKEKWIKNHTIDLKFLEGIRRVINAQTMLIPHVYLWHKDEADYREASAVSTTQVGATLSLVDMKTGKILWEATDENYKEAVRSEMRSVVSSGGYVRRIEGVSVTGQDVYSAPPYGDVAVLVLESIVEALPRKGAIE